MTKAKRIFELDFLRGLSIFLMMLHHGAYDLRYIFGLDHFAFLANFWFIELIRPFFLCIFIFVSGICCQFSRDNLKRSARLCVMALLLNVAMYVYSSLSGDSAYIYFNILHLLTVAIFVCGLIDVIVKKQEKMDPDGKKRRWPQVTYIFLAIVPLYADRIIMYINANNPIHQITLLPLGLIPKDGIHMGDYLPLIPWIGFFFAGALFGHFLYDKRQSLLPNLPLVAKRISAPVTLMGRYSLWFYLVHQPILLAILYGLRYFDVL